MKTVLVTGGAGFIGSHFARRLLLSDTDLRVIVFDLLTYAGRRENLADLEADPRFEFVQGDIRDREAVDAVMARSQWVAHFAAETHNDRAILDSGDFVLTDVFGSLVLLQSARTHRVERFLYMSTDEVYGSIVEGEFTEQSPIAPNMPYAASKAGGELMARAYFKTFGVPVIIARGANNFGPNQYPEKFMPLFITNALQDRPLPLYGDGSQVRDWIYVKDCASALDTVLRNGTVGEAYNVGVGWERRNRQVAGQILDLLGKPHDLIQSVTDRPGHDVRYALDTAKLRQLGWSPEYDFDQALAETVRWYVENREWWQRIREEQPEFKAFYQQWYGERSPERSDKGGSG